MALNLDEARKLRDILTVAIEAAEVATEKPPEAPAPVDLAAWKTSQRNRLLAGSGVKAELLGTLSTEPTLTAKALTDLDVYPSLAADILAAAAESRAVGKALDAELAEPVKVLKP